MTFYVAKQNDFKLVELVKKNRHLYDRNHKDYRDSLKKELTWREIAATLGNSEDALRKRFRNLRDRFTKEKRRKDVHNDPTLPLIYKKMLFLVDHLKHRQRDDDNSLNETYESSETLLDEQAEDNLEDSSELDQTAKEPSYDGSLENQIVYVLDESGNLIAHRATPFEKENSSDSESAEIKQPKVLLAFKGPEGKQIKLEKEDAEALGLTEKSLKNLGSEAHDEVESERNTKKNSTSNGTGESEENQRTSAGEIVVAVRGNNGDTERPNKSAADKEKNEAAQLGEAESSIEGKSSRKPQNDVSNTDKKNSGPVIVNTYMQRVDPGHNYSKVENAVQKDDEVRVRPKQIVRFRKRKIIGINQAYGSQVKRRERIVEVPNNQAGTSSEGNVNASKNCNEAFCIMVKHYLDEITAPVALSAARLQILTMLHNELYSAH